MGWDFQKLRRWSGAVYLAVSLGMLGAGLTILNNRLQGVTFVYYWLICAMFTCLALMIALLDLRAVRRRSRQAQSELLHEILTVVAERKAKSNRESEVPKKPE